MSAMVRGLGAARDDGRGEAGAVCYRGSVDEHHPSGTGEARRDYRPPVKLVWPVEIEPVVRGRGARIRAMTHGVSIGGAFIVTDLALAPGTSIYVWLHPPALGENALHEREPPVLRFRAEVRWLSEGAQRDVPRGFGVAFRALTAADEMALHGYFSRAYKVL